MSIASRLYSLFNSLSGTTPDPQLELIKGDRVTTDFYPYPGAPETYLVRMYAEKQEWNGRMRLKLQFSHVKGDELKAAMMDQTANDYIPGDNKNLTLAQAVARLAAFVRRKEDAHEPHLAPPANDNEVHLRQAVKIIAGQTAPQPKL